MIVEMKQFGLNNDKKYDKYIYMPSIPANTGGGQGDLLQYYSMYSCFLFISFYSHVLTLKLAELLN